MCCSVKVYNVVLSLVTFGSSSSYRFAYTDIIKSQFERWEKIEQVEDMWTFLLDDFVPIVYPEEWYNAGSNDNMKCPDEKGVFSLTTRNGPCQLSKADRLFC